MDTAALSEKLYEELLVIARRLRRGEREDHTLETTALVHEAFLRLANQEAAGWQGRSHFLGSAATTMRRILVDYARERGAAKRDGGEQTTLVSIPDGKTSHGNALDVLALDDVLRRLAVMDARKARIVELRVFGGFDIGEISGILGVSRSTVKRDWEFAKGWLAYQLLAAQ